MNSLYSGPVASSFNEAIADVWAMYITDFNIVGNDIIIAGTPKERDGENTVQFCGDCAGNEDCHGSSPQQNGLPLMGALWKVRSALKTAHGEALGGATADALFLAWMNAFNTRKINSVIEYQWLILDDDDGILCNGTPNFVPIDDAFSLKTIPPTTNEFPGAQCPPIPFCPGAVCGTLDFATDDFGTLLVNGQDITTPPEFGNRVLISATGLNNFGAAIFDSTPGGPNAAGSDPDLLVGLGNILILQESGTQTFPGIFDAPDDAQLGGTMVFDFVDPVELFSVDLVDIDTGPPSQDVTITLFSQGGGTRTYDVPGGWTNDVFDDGLPGFRSLFLNTLLGQPGFQSTATASQQGGFVPEQVERLEIQFDGSGAVDNLSFCVIP